MIANKPPPYTPLSEMTFSSMGIKASDTPQWLWSNAEARIWITAVCIACLNYSLEESEAIANKFKGMGNFLFAMRIEEWGKMSKEPEDGSSTFNLIVSRNNLKGAVPPGLSVSHHLQKDGQQK